MKKETVVQIISNTLVVSLALFMIARAWTEPTATPPGANVPAPINVGNVGQEKAGGLIVNTGGAATGLIVDKGSVGIGTNNPLALLDILGKIRIADGTQDAGKVLTSDANGIASWMNAVGGGSGSLGFGARETKSAGVIYQAASDGFVNALYIAAVNPGSGEVRGYTGLTSPPTTRFAADAGVAAGGVSVAGYGSFTMPVHKGEYWQVVKADNSYANPGTAEVYWTPLIEGAGSGGSGGGSPTSGVSVHKLLPNASGIGGYEVQLGSLTANWNGVPVVIYANGEAGNVNGVWNGISFYVRVDSPTGPTIRGVGSTTNAPGSYGWHNFSLITQYDGLTKGPHTFYLSALGNVPYSETTSDVEFGAFELASGGSGGGGGSGSAGPAGPAGASGPAGPAGANGLQYVGSCITDTHGSQWGGFCQVPGATVLLLQGMKSIGTTFNGNWSMTSGVSTCYTDSLSGGFGMVGGANFVGYSDVNATCEFAGFK